MLKKLIGNKVSSAVLAKKYAIIGAVMAIGSIGLILGGITCTVSVLLMKYAELELVTAMAAGFFISGFSILAIGIGLILKK